MLHVGPAELALVLGQIVLALVAWLQRRDANRTKVALEHLRVRSEGDRRDDESTISAINLASVMATNLQASTTHLTTLTNKLLNVESRVEVIDATLQDVNMSLVTATELMGAITTQREERLAALQTAIEAVPEKVEERLMTRFEVLGKQISTLNRIADGIQDLGKQTSQTVTSLWTEYREMASQLHRVFEGREAPESKPEVPETKEELPDANQQ
jgi:predicted  nucleic acid-binding Zn-ribbon protein